ncbi:MAG: helix-hairpin-helix domain-containing protein [Chloroflexi bacterium]|nr:helix-hairpin-helix domain-containing protein [Chloroflexota bacterium]
MSRSDRILIAAGGAAIVLAATAGWILLLPGTGQGAESTGPDGAALLIGTPAAAASAEMSGSPQPATIVVDVEGAVLEPGIRELPSGARVADALSAAGGYAPDADLEAAAATINLAERLTDGAQVVVPRIGAGTAPGGPNAAASGEPSSGGGNEPNGPLNINTASADELEALPGVGPVTVDRIIAGRRERPFTSLEDAVERGVLNRGQLDDLEGLATAD